MSPRAKGVIILGATVLVAAAVLAVYVRTSDDATPATVADATPTPSRPATDVQTRGGGVTQSVQPRLPGDGSAAAPARPDGVREYDVGGRRVRDHRTNAPPLDLPPAIHPPQGRLIDPLVTRAITEQVKSTMRECAKALAPEARGAKPRLDGLVVVAIKDKQVSVTSANVQLRDVTGDTVAAVKQCIEHKSVGLAASAGAEADLPSYDITISYAL